MNNDASRINLVKRSRDDVVLQIGGEADEIFAVAADADDQIAVFVRFLLRFKQGGGIENVDGELLAAVVEERLPQADEAVAAFRRVEEGFLELQLEDETAFRELMVVGEGGLDGGRLWS